MVFMVIEGFGKADPDVENAQAAAHTAHKVIGRDVAQRRVNDEEAIVRPG